METAYLPSAKISPQRLFAITEEKGFPGGSVVKNPPAMQEIRILSLGQKDPLEKEMATHSSIIAWKIPWTEEPRGLQSMGLLSRVRLSD